MGKLGRELQKGRRKVAWTVHREKGNGQLLRVRLKREEEGCGSWNRGGDNGVCPATNQDDGLGCFKDDAVHQRPCQV